MELLRIGIVLRTILGSLKTAEHLGFKFIRSYNFLSIFNKTRNHEAS